MSLRDEIISRAHSVGQSEGIEMVLIRMDEIVAAVGAGLSPADKDLLDQIFETRRQNNIPWRQLMELALQHAPEQAKAALREIADNDVMVAAGIRHLAK